MQELALAAQHLRRSAAGGARDVRVLDLQHGLGRAVGPLHADGQWAGGRRRRHDVGRHRPGPRVARAASPRIAARSSSGKRSFLFSTTIERFPSRASSIRGEYSLRIRS